MRLGITSKEFHYGPGHIALEFVHFAIEDPLPPVPITFSDIVKGLKESKAFSVGYQNDPERYGPFLKEKIIEQHFKPIKSEDLLPDFRSFLNGIKAAYEEWWIHDTDFLVDKLAFNTRFIPADQTSFYHFTPSTTYFSNDGIPGLTDEVISGFNFFYCAVGYNQERLYLFSAWWD